MTGSPSCSHRASAAGEVLSNADLLERILGDLWMREAAQAARTCKSFQAAVQLLTAAQGFKPRLVVACSGSHKLVDVDVTAGSVISSTPAHNCRHHWKSASADGKTSCIGLTRRARVDWLTAIAFAPDHRLWACHYAMYGVVAYDHSSSVRKERPKAVFCHQGTLMTPEGICFTDQYVYVARLLPNCTSKAQLCNSMKSVATHFCGEAEVPWGIAASPDGKALFAACNRAYECTDYHSDRPPREAPGHVQCIPLQQNGSFGKAFPLCETSPEAELIRPSGLCFDCNGRLLVTTMSGQVHRYHKPDSEQCTLGRLDRTLLTLPPDLGNPWDVKASKDLVFVSVHRGNEFGRILILDLETGEQLRCVGGDGSLDQPNMLAVE